MRRTHNPTLSSYLRSLLLAVDLWRPAALVKMVHLMISNFENLNLELLNDVNVVVSEFVKILDFAAKNSLVLANVKKKRSGKSQIWYDTECHNLIDEQTRFAVIIL